MPNDSRPHREPAQGAWDEHSLSQLRYFRSLSLREKLQAVEGMADVVRHFQRVRARGGFSGASGKTAAPVTPDVAVVREASTEYGPSLDPNDNPAGLGPQRGPDASRKP